MTTEIREQNRSAMSSSPLGRRIEVSIVIPYPGGGGADGKYVEDAFRKLFVPGIKNTEFSRQIFRVARGSGSIHGEN